VWRSGARPGSGGQRALNAVIRGDDERSPRAPAAHAAHAAPAPKGGGGGRSPRAPAAHAAPAPKGGGGGRSPRAPAAHAAPAPGGGGGGRSPRAPAVPAPGGGRQAWGSSDSDQLPQLASRSPKKIVVVCDGDVVQRQTLLLYKRTSQTFEQVLDDLSAMFRAPVRNMFTVDGVQVSVDRVCQCQCQ